MSSHTRERRLSEEELRHWQEETGEKKPVLDLDAFAAEVAADKILRAQPRYQPVYDPLHPGRYDNIDRATARTIRRGQMQVDAGIDLHGLNAEQAYVVMKEFVREQCDAGARLVLVITGKGKYQEGRLRSLLPRWVNEPDLRPYILSLDVARPRDGGSGAYYLLLKQKRKLQR
jgi:DNA-nicking Smr family endonuclease